MYVCMYDYQQGLKNSVFSFFARECWEFQQQKIFFKNPFRIRIFLFLSHSFEIETINTFKHSRSSLENHTRFQTKMGKVYTRLQIFKKVQKPYPLGRHIVTY